jgi:rRNA maturation endonuclease Nob1
VKKNKSVQYECSRCHTLYPEYIKRLKLINGQFESVRVHPDHCEVCGSGLQRRVKKEVKK